MKAVGVTSCCRLREVVAAMCAGRTNAEQRASQRRFASGEGEEGRGGERRQEEHEISHDRTGAERNQVVRDHDNDGLMQNVERIQQLACTTEELPAAPPRLPRGA